MTAPTTAAAMTAARFALPRDAMTPPTITAISPGKTMPTNAEASSAGNANTTARRTQPCRPRIHPTTENASARTKAMGILPSRVGRRPRWTPGRRDRDNDRPVKAISSLVLLGLLATACGASGPPQATGPSQTPAGPSPAVRGGRAPGPFVPPPDARIPQSAQPPAPAPAPTPRAPGPPLPRWAPSGDPSPGHPPPDG